jgi:hypothetical protein
MRLYPSALTLMKGETGGFYRTPRYWGDAIIFEHLGDKYSLTLEELYEVFVARMREEQLLRRR